MTPSLQADAKFLRRVLFGLVMMTVLTGAMAAITTVGAMNRGEGHCIVLCQ